MRLEIEDRTLRRNLSDTRFFI